MYNYEKKSVVFKKSFLLWGLGTLITIYVFLRVIFGTGETIRFLGSAAVSSMEKDILEIALYENKIPTYGEVKFIGILTVSEFYKENHLFYVSDYPNIGPAFILVQTLKSFHENPYIEKYGVFPFMPYSSAESLSYIKKQFKGYEFKFPDPKVALSTVLEIRSKLEKQCSYRTKLAWNE